MSAPSAYERDIARWRDARVRRLQAADGWLTLVDRQVLADGENELPPGNITIRGDEALFRVRPGATVMFEGRPLPSAGPGSELVLRSEDGGASDTLWHEDRAYELFRVGDLFVVRVKDPRAPGRLAFRGVDHFPVDPRWRIVAAFERYEPPRHTAHEYDIGPGRRRQVPGVARFVIEGHDNVVALEPVLEEDSQRLFFVFGDHTNRTQTSPTGRFLYAEQPSGSEVILDFNTAFNPPCAFTPHATCPVTPPQHRLPVAITAGERRYAG